MSTHVANLKVAVWGVNASVNKHIIPSRSPATIPSVKTLPADFSASKGEETGFGDIMAVLLLPAVAEKIDCFVLLPFHYYLLYTETTVCFSTGTPVYVVRSIRFVLFAPTCSTGHQGTLTTTLSSPPSSTLLCEQISYVV